MDFCFLFTQHLTDEGCLSLKISQDGALVAPIIQRTFDEIKSLQKECKTCVIESTINASILDLELPWLPERKARAAIPYALEDKVAQGVEELHFAFDKLRYQHNKYLIVAISKQKIQKLISFLTQQEIQFDILTLDWFALSAQQSCINESTLLAYYEDFKGALTQDMAISYLKKHPLNEPLLFANNSLNFNHSLTPDPRNSFLWIAQQLIQTQPMNLVQGDLIQKSTSKWMTNGYQIAGILGGIWLSSLLLVNALSYFILNKKNNELDKKIEVIYRQFFPEAKQVISPKFRISQLIGSQSTQGSNFWNLLNVFAQVIKKNNITIEEMRYQNNTLFVTLLSTDFASLERLENQLRQLQLKVKKTQASTKDQGVIATLELT